MTVSNENTITILQTALATIMSCQFAGTGGTEVTDWGICPECCGADWKGHNEDCQVLKNIDAINSYLDELKAEHANCSEIPNT